MKKLIFILSFSLISLLLLQCNTDNINNKPKERSHSSSDSSQQKKNKELKVNQNQNATIAVDSTKLLTFNHEQISHSEIIDSCMKYIKHHYDKQFYNDYFNTYDEDYYAHKLTLRKYKTYEDSMFFIISFYEREKYNETDLKSYSSILFRKEKNKLTQLIPTIPDSLSFRSLPLIDKLEYPGRFSGVPFLIADLTGDNKNDFMFRSESSLKLKTTAADSPSTEYLIYYQNGNNLAFSNFSHNEFENKNESNVYKKKLNFSLLEKTLGIPLFQFEIIEYRHKIKETSRDSLAPKFSMIITYQWNRNTNTFERIHLE